MLQKLHNSRQINHLQQSGIKTMKKGTGVLHFILVSVILKIIDYLLKCLIKTKKLVNGSDQKQTISNISWQFTARQLLFDIINSRKCLFQHFFAQTFVLRIALKSYFLNLKQILEPFYYITVNCVDISMIKSQKNFVSLCIFYA